MSAHESGSGYHLPDVGQHLHANQSHSIPEIAGKPPPVGGGGSAASSSGVIRVSSQNLESLPEAVGVVPQQQQPEKGHSHRRDSKKAHIQAEDRPSEGTDRVGSGRQAAMRRADSADKSTPSEQPKTVCILPMPALGSRSSRIYPTFGESVFLALRIMRHTLRLMLPMALFVGGALTLDSYVGVFGTSYYDAVAEDGYPAASSIVGFKLGRHTAALSLSTMIMSCLLGMPQVLLGTSVVYYYLINLVTWDRPYFQTRYVKLKRMAIICVLASGVYKFGFDFAVSTGNSSLLLSHVVYFLLYYGIIGFLIWYGTIDMGVAGMRPTLFLAIASGIVPSYYLYNMGVMGFSAMPLWQKCIFRFLEIPLRTFMVHVIVHFALKVEDKTLDGRLVPWLLHGVAVPAIVGTSLVGRVLQVGGTTFAQSLLMEAVAVVIELWEIMGLAAAETDLTRLANLMNRLRKKKVAPFDPNQERMPGSFGRLEVSTRTYSVAVDYKELMFSLIVLDYMVAEGISTFCACVVLLAYRINLDTSADAFDLTTPLVNAIVSFVGETILADFVVVTWLVYRGNQGSHTIGGWKLVEIWRQKGDRLYIRSWTLLSVAIAISCARQLCFVLCPTFDSQDSLFFKACSEEQYAYFAEIAESGPDYPYQW